MMDVLVKWIISRANTIAPSQCSLRDWILLHANEFDMGSWYATFRITIVWCVERTSLNLIYPLSGSVSVIKGPRNTFDSDHFPSPQRPIPILKVSTIDLHYLGLLLDMIQDDRTVNRWRKSPIKNRYRSISLISTTMSTCSLLRAVLFSGKAARLIPRCALSLPLYWDMR